MQVTTPLCLAAIYCCFRSIGSPRGHEGASGRKCGGSAMILLGEITAFRSKIFRHQSAQVCKGGDEITYRPITYKNQPIRTKLVEREVEASNLLNSEVAFSAK